MKSKLSVLKQLRRTLLLLFVCLFTGIGSLRAGVHFKDEGMMTLVHNPTILQPYIIVDVLYFDAYGGDGYFTTYNTQGGNPGAAVYVNDVYIGSPSELTWNADQKGANNWRDKNGWAGAITENDKAVIRFYDPHHEAESGAAEDRYRVYMYIFLKNWEAGKEYTVKVKGRWKINAKDGVAGSEAVEMQTVKTAAFSDPWSTPDKAPSYAVMKTYNSVKVNGGLSYSYGDTKVGFSTANTKPTDYNASPSNAVTYSRGTYKFENQNVTGFNVEGNLSDNYKNPRKLYVQYCFPLTNANCVNSAGTSVTMTVYKWFDLPVKGFTYAKNLSFQSTNTWKKKVRINWDIYDDNATLSNEGTWTLTDADGAVLKSNLSSTTTSTEITLPSSYEYFQKYPVNVIFIPKNLTNSKPTELSAGVEAKIEPDWKFTSFEAKEIPQGESNSGKVNLTWKFPALEDASTNNKYQFEILRSDDGGKNYSQLSGYNEFIADNSLNSISFIDQTVESSRTYHYKVKVRVFGQDKYSDVAQVRSGGSKIKSFSASRGSYSNLVKLQWSIDLVGSSANFIIKRRPLGGSSDSEWSDIYTTSGTATSYSYDDVTALPGSFNEYQIIIWSECTETVNNVPTTVWNEDDSETTDGFSISTGIVSGNVTYGTGTAVKDVKVTLKQQNVDGVISSGMHSLLFSADGSGMKYSSNNKELKSLLGKDFSIQMYLNPNDGEMSTSDSEYSLFSLGDILKVNLKCFTTTIDENTIYSYKLSGNIGDQTISSSQLSIPAGQWTHLSLVYKESTGNLTAIITKNDLTQSEVIATNSSFWGTSDVNSFVIGNNNDLNSATAFKGNVDEFRIWTKALTDQDILHNYNHPLAGNESGLAVYYPFDEGMSPQKLAYDFSKKNGVSNGRHAYADVPPASSEFTPNENQLSLMSYTDANGYYEIRGVPFMGEGTSYSVIPTMGIHEFSPSSKSRYVSMSTLNHSGVDFSDVSSFPVSGRVFYDKTDYPVEGVNFYIDGNICSKDGEVIETKADGEFTISVPIGDHFISVKKNGHEFVDGGRYPSDQNNVGTKHTFDREIKNLEFVDKTLVNFTGRVVGGNIEGDKTVGFGLSNNNIGVAELVLTPLNDNYRMNVVKVFEGETTYSYETNTATVPLASATDLIKSTSWRGAAADGGDDFKKLFIRTDAATGEFSAMVPPLQYAIGTITVVKGNKELAGSSTTIDLTNPSIEYTDTLFNDDGTYELYAYNTMLNYVYHTDSPSFIVTQEDDIHGEGTANDHAFGIRNYKITDAVGTLTIDDIYSIENGTPVYKYGDGSAIFVMNDRYTFNIEAFEEYVNEDGDAPVVDHVPLAGTKVTIENALSDEQPIYTETDASVPDAVAGQVYELQSNQLKLDDEGKAVYSWMAGMPNIISPYYRTITITYDIDGRTYLWSGSGMKGVILGSIPTGNNFVTNGPDMVDMILRDPPGSNSFAEWTSGTIKSTSNAALATFNNNTKLKTSTHLGTKIATVSGVGVAVLNQVEAKQNWDLGLNTKVEFEGGGTWSTSTEVTKTISTSDSEDYVGADGDVFIGKATNVLFGKARNVDFHRNQAGNGAVLSDQDVIATGLSFGTLFSYSQKYIENELIPHLKDVRNSFLTVTTESDKNSRVNDGTKPIYLTTVPKTDIEKHGSDNDDKGVWGSAATATLSSNGPSYRMVLPESAAPDEIFQDDVMYYNTQIETWEKYLELNEKEKVEANENRNDKDVVKSYKNFSFDSGTKVNNSVETQDSEGHKISIQGEVGIVAGTEAGIEADGNGVLISFETETGIGYKHENEANNTDKTVMSYTLAESGSDDALTVDVYEYGAYGPIFRTLGGQTSAPYEGEVVTKYYQPGTTIMEATMQIEVPQIKVDVSDVSDVPTGSAANYTLHLGNASEVNKDVTYKLFLLDGTNPNGAKISIDGQPLTDGRLINVKGGEEIIKSLQILQTNQSILDYENIGIVFASVSQPGDINSTVYLTAHFTPSSSPVSLSLSKRLMNTSNGTNLVLTFKDFDRNYINLKAFRLQYKKDGATDWTELKEYVLNAADKTTNNEYLSDQGAEVSFALSMESFSDGDYTFRVESASTYGLGEVHRYSEELTLVKDMQRPTPMGQPEPADGILNIGDDLSVTFNENIIKGEITKVANFKVTGVLNGQPVAHWTALSMQNTATTAQTEANINLAGKDFSFDAWVNLSSNAAGTLLSHGNGTAKMTVGINADKKLVVNIAGETYTSVNTVPTGKWAFLTLSYRNTATGSVLNASVADDANTTNLFIDQAVVKYEGNGRLAVGKNITGSIHELLLWDEAHDMTTALLNRSKTKNPSTRHLIGYWKMDEGEGKSIRDYARNRHMTMADATWYMNNANKSVVLNGANYLSIDASSLPVCVDDDYVVEFWMRGAAQTDAQLFQMGEIALWVKADGTLQFIGKNAFYDAEAVSFETNATNLTDNAWHHIAVNVLRQGATAVYVDGVRCLTTSSSNVGSINTNNLLLGVRRTTVSAETGTYGYDRTFTGQIDEIRVWNATMNSDMLIKNRKVRLTGREDGLVAYYAFEAQTLDEGNQVISVGSAKDLTSNLNAELLAVSNQQNADITYSDEAPAMRQKPTETNVSFTFVASNEKVIINIDEDPAIIEGCTLNFTVRDLRDENGNYSVPAVWSAFVNRNELVWEEDEISIEQEVKEGGEISAYIMNNGGTQQMWTLSGMPSWLTASSEYGTTNPLSESEVTFYVSPATPIGKYEETIYLKGNDGIETPLTLKVNVTGQEPDWYVNSRDYMVSMNVIGQVMVQGVPMNDADDLVAAFIGDECRGLAHPVYSSRYDGYYVTMNIYGNDGDNNQNVTFRAYDASTGTLYPEVLSSSEIKFDYQALVGTYANPQVLTATNKIEQSTDLNQGWNWVSFFVDTENSSAQSFLESIADDVEAIKSQTEWLMNENGTWGGNLPALSNNQMYIIKMKSDRTLRLVGNAVDPSQNPIVVKHGWNWIGYYGRQVSSLADALSWLDPRQSGDVLKGQDGVAYYDEYEWSGSLIMMEPGAGYMFKSEYNADRSNSTGSHAPMRSQSVNGAGKYYTFNAVDYRNYSGNAMMTAKIVDRGAPVANVEIGVFADGECRAVAVTNENGIAYITIPGDDAVELTFKIAKGADITELKGTLSYETDAIFGSPLNPIVFSLDGTTGIKAIDNARGNDAVYDIQGRKISDDSNDVKGIRIINGQKELVR